MATIKSYTDFSQSKKLAEILPLESADMHYHYDNDFGELESIPTITEEDDHFSLFPKDFSCWSLASLLNVLPEPELTQGSDRRWMLRIWDKKRLPWTIGGHVNPIEACYEMIIKLHELNLL